MNRPLPNSARLTRASLMCAGAAAALGLAAPAGAQVIEFPVSQWSKVNPVYSANQADLVTSFNRRAPNFERIASFSKRNRYRLLAAPVGRIELLVQKNEGEGRRAVTYCTGTIISPQYIITNYHCIPGKSFKVLAARIRFEYHTRQSKGRVYPLAIAPSESDRNLDYAIVRVGQNPSARYGYIKIRPRPAEAGEELFIIHHPLGQPKRLTRKDCRAAPSGHFKDQFLRHRCDTEGGSSGSLIFSDVTGRLVGLHFAGGLNSAKPDSANHAIRISMLVQHSKILQALAKGQKPPVAAVPPGTTPAGTTPAGTTPARTTPSGNTPSGTTPLGKTPAGTNPGTGPGISPGNTPGTGPGTGPGAGPGTGPGAGPGNSNRDARVARYLMGTWNGALKNGRQMTLRFRQNGRFQLVDKTRGVAVIGNWRIQQGRVLLVGDKTCTRQGCQRLPQARRSWFAFRAVSKNTMQTRNGTFQRVVTSSTF